MKEKSFQEFVEESTKKLATGQLYFLLAEAYQKGRDSVYQDLEARIYAYKEELKARDNKATGDSK